MTALLTRSFAHFFGSASVTELVPLPRVEGQPDITEQRDVDVCIGDLLVLRLCPDTCALSRRFDIECAQQVRERAGPHSLCRIPATRIPDDRHEPDCRIRCPEDTEPVEDFVVRPAIPRRPQFAGEVRDCARPIREGETDVAQALRHDAQLRLEVGSRVGLGELTARLVEFRQDNRPVQSLEMRSEDRFDVAG